MLQALCRKFDLFNPPNKLQMRRIDHNGNPEDFAFRPIGSRSHFHSFWKIAYALFLLPFFLFAQPSITKEQADYIAQKVWQNEGALQDKYLVHWNDGEDFASLGIGHFIWFPKGHSEKFREVFPMVLKSMEEKNTTMPSWLGSQTPCPWNSKAELFEAKAKNEKRYAELLMFIKQTMPEQAMFMSQRAFDALPLMLSTIGDSKEKEIIRHRYNKILYNSNGTISEHGLYILIDYVNFKGEGTLESERYNGQGWGLLQVLQNMDYKEKDRFKAFSDSAKAMLSRRIENSPKARGEERWRIGWNKRLDTYLLKELK